jgi:hypothetical protein
VLAAKKSVPPIPRIAAAALPLRAARLRGFGLGQGRKPVLPGTAVRADASPPADHDPLFEECVLNIDPLELGEIPGAVGSLHVNGLHRRNRRQPPLRRQTVWRRLKGLFER